MDSSSQSNTVSLSQPSSNLPTIPNNNISSTNATPIKSSKPPQKLISLNSFPCYFRDFLSENTLCLSSATTSLLHIIAYCYFHQKKQIFSNTIRLLYYKQL